MEEDLTLGNEEEVTEDATEEVEEVESYFIDYHSYIAAGYSALAAILEVNPLTEPERKRIDNIRKKSLYLLSSSLDKLVTQFDLEHSDD